MMVLPWVMNYITGTLTCKITDTLEYEAISGGFEGYYKRIKDSETEDIKEFFIESKFWEAEKHWISENYSHIVGQYEPNNGGIFYPNPLGGESDFRFGRDSEGGRLDHLQRPQALMHAEDCAIIAVIDALKFETPDRGLTIFKVLPIEGSKTNYADKDSGILWTEVPQPCHMQPWIKGRQLSNYDELFYYIQRNLPYSDYAQEILDKCKAGQWDAPRRPDLQKFYVYPTS